MSVAIAPATSSKACVLGLFAAASILCVSGVAAAQPCCAGASALTPARLELHEDALVGLQTRVTDVYGSFDDKRRFVSPDGAREVDFEEDLVGSVRFLHHAQAALLVPLEETYRSAGGTSEAGGGFGDLQTALRYDFLEAGASTRVPGIALLGALTFPTGRPIEDATTPLGTSATGTGSFQAALGASFEQSFGSVLVDLTGSGTWRAPRTAAGIHEQDGILFVASTAVAYSFAAGPVAAFSITYNAELDGTLEGKTVADGGKAFTRLGLSLGYPFSVRWRMQSVIFSDVPIRGFGQSEPTGVGASFILIRSWS